MYTLSVNSLLLWMVMQHQNIITKDNPHYIETSGLEFWFLSGHLFVNKKKKKIIQISIQILILWDTLQYHTHILVKTNLYSIVAHLWYESCLWFWLIHWNLQWKVFFVLFSFSSFNPFKYRSIFIKAVGKII